MKNNESNYSPKKFTFSQINSEIINTVPGVKYKILIGILLSLTVRAIPVIISILISYLINKNISQEFSIIERLMIIIPISIANLFVMLKFSQVFLNFWHSRNVVNLMSNIGAQFSQKTFEKLSYLPSEYVISKDSKEWAFLLNKRQEIINGISLFYMQFITMTVELSFAILFLFLTNQYFIGTLSLILILFSLFFRFNLTGFLVEKLTTLLRTQSKILNHSNEMISRLYLAKIFHSEDFLVNLRNKEEQHEMNLYVKYKLVFNILATIQDLILNTAIIFVFYLGISNVENSVTTIGLFVASFTLMTNALTQLGTSFYIFDGIYSLVGATQTHMEISQKHKEMGSPNKRIVYDELPKEKLFIENIVFGYNEKVILKNINFSIHPNEKIFLVGPSGAGKTTLLKVLLGLQKPFSGTIKFQNGHSAIMPFSFVPQTLDLFSYSIRNNLLLGKPNSTDEELMQVLRKVNMLQKVNQNGGLDTGINNFSGGEQQRISIARAILSDKPYMLLDEPTSSLDLKNEKIIIEELMNDDHLSFIFCTHRLQSIPNEAKVIVLCDSEIVQSGLKEDLINQEGLFKTLYFQNDKE